MFSTRSQPRRRAHFTHTSPPAAITSFLARPDNGKRPTSGTAQIGFTAAAGYDLASGLGSIDAFNLVTSWTSVSSSSTDSGVLARRVTSSLRPRRQR